MEKKKVAIIGAGASGIGVAKTLLEAGIEFEIIEATERFGGNWQPDGPASKMYDSVHLISSKRNTQFSDFPMPEDYSNYPRHNLVFKYLEQLAEHHGLRERTRFNTTVVQMLKDSEGWLLRFENGDESLYDLVVVCNGLLRTPKIPSVSGKFSGESIHASSYRSSEQFRGKRVLVVGSGNSGCDITVDAAQTAASAFHSVRRGYHYMPKFINGQPTQEWLMEEGAKFSNEEKYWEHVQSTFKLAGFDGQDYGLPAPDHKMQECHPIMNSQILYYIGHGDVLVKPQITRFDDKTVHFSDGSTETIDMIVWATGYDISLPFISNEVFDWRANMNSLFLRMVPAEHDDLLFVGYLNSPSGIGNLANIMSRFVSSYIKARAMKTPAWHALNQMKLSPSSLDLGQQRFMKTSRHKYEVDLWKYIKAVNFVTAKLQSTTPV